MKLSRKILIAFGAASLALIAATLAVMALATS